MGKRSRREHVPQEEVVPIAKVTVTPNRQAIARYMNSSGPVQSYLDQKARQVEERAKSLVPFDEGELRDSFRIATISRVGGGPSVPGIVAHGRTVTAESEHAAYVHFGTGPQHTDNEGLSSPRDNYWPAPSIRLVAWAERNIPEVIRRDRFGNTNIYLLQRHIFRQGTPATPFMLDALKLVFPEARGRFSEV